MSYMNVERQSRKWENDVLMERVVQPLYWRESLHIVASKIIRIHILVFWQTLVFFNQTFKYQRVVLMMLLCVNLLKDPTLAWMKRHSLLHWETEKSTVVHWPCRWLVKRRSRITVFLRLYLVTYWWYTTRQRDVKPLPLIGFLATLQQADIMQDILTHHLQNQWMTVDHSIS